jgi:hypothetical protein
MSLNRTSLMQLKELIDHTGALPPILKSRTRQQAQDTGESFATVKTSPTSPRSSGNSGRNWNYDCSRNTKLRNKLRNEKRKIRLKDRKSERTVCLCPLALPLPLPVETINEEDSDEFGDPPRDQLPSEQKPGVSFPNDSCLVTDLTSDLEAIALTQYTLKRGLKEFGNDGIVALGKEMEQLHTRKVAKPADESNLTRDQKWATLQYLMFLSKKRCGRVKARGCADGRKQRKTTSKEDASAPTVAIESVMLSATVDAMEGCDIVTVDIPGAFVQADIDEVVHVKFEGEIAEMLVRMDPAKLYRKYVKDEHGKLVLYVELLKALYGTLRAALLFWKLLSSKLVLWGFEINPYDWWAANKMIDRKQYTVLWHADGLKISHLNPDVNTCILELIEAEFGKESLIPITRGRIHDYLEMTPDYSEKGKVKSKMLDYIEKMLADLPAKMDGEAPTPTANHLFTVDGNQTKVDKEKA